MNSEIVKSKDIVLLRGGESQQHPVFTGEWSANRANLSLQVKRKEEDRDQKTAVCLERETRHLLRLSLFSLIDSKESKERCSCF